MKRILKQETMKNTLIGIGEATCFRLASSSLSVYFYQLVNSCYVHNHIENVLGTEFGFIKRSVMNIHLTVLNLICNLSTYFKYFPGKQIPTER